uniref:Uncharacterized protein n=1 Tax=Spongospora subterranea TaxID=70186 RepID=A0A0H5RPK4_9EUKA|eukprot:CRZ10654.1 hypothetical protein [Spongospora subterranea]
MVADIFYGAVLLVSLVAFAACSIQFSIRALHRSLGDGRPTLLTWLSSLRILDDVSANSFKYVPKIENQQKISPQSPSNYEFEDGEYTAEEQLWLAEFGWSDDVLNMEPLSEEEIKPTEELENFRKNRSQSTSRTVLLEQMNQALQASVTCCTK